MQVEMTGDEAKLVRALARAETRAAKFEAKLKQVGKAGRKAGDDTGKAMKRATEQGFGRSQLTKIGKYAIGLGSVATALGLVTRGLSFMQQESAAALASLRGLTDARRRLNQIATSPEDLRALDERSDRLSRRFGVERQTVKNLLFSARSENFEPSVAFILKNKNIIDVATQATLAGQIPGLFPGQGLTAKQSINLALVAAGQSRLNVQQITSALPSVSTGAGLAGSSPEETFALLSVLAGRLASGQQAADRGKAFGTKVGITPGFRGKGIIGAFDILEAGTEGERRKFLGESQELNVFYDILKTERDEVVKRTRELERARLRTGTPESAIMQARERARLNPKIQATNVVEQSEIYREIARENAFAKERAQIEAIQNNTQAILDEAGASGARKFVVRGAQEIAEFVGAGPVAVGVTGAVASNLFNPAGSGQPDEIGNRIAFMTATMVAAAQELIVAAQKLSAAGDHIDRALGGGPALKPPGVDK